jgi:hypothetical protein
MAQRCFTDAQTTLYQRGYPHLVQLVDDHEDDKKPDPTKIFAKSVFGRYHVRWPRKTAQAFVRACTTQPSRMISTPADAAPITIDDVRTCLAHQLAAPRQLAFFADHELVFCIEALVGTDATLSVLVDLLCTLPEERWPAAGTALDPESHAKPDFMAPQIHRANVLGSNGAVGYYAYLTGYLLLRATADVAARSREALESLWQRTVDAGVPPIEETLRGGLDLALHGVEGARRILPESHWQYLHWWGFVDDAAMLRARVVAKGKSEWFPDPRHVWLVPELAELLLDKKFVKRVPDRVGFFADVAMIDHPAVAKLMREHVADKKVGPLATAWLDAHA